MVHECITGELLIRDQLMYRNDNGHSDLKQCAVLKWLANAGKIRMDS